MIEFGPFVEVQKILKLCEKNPYIPRDVPTKFEANPNSNKEDIAPTIFGENAENQGVAGQRLQASYGPPVLSKNHKTLWK